MDNILPFILTSIAGLSTLLGTVFIFFKISKDKLIKYALAFASGVMISVSFNDLIPESLNYIITSISKDQSFILLIIFIFIGIIIAFTLDTIIPNKNTENKKLYRVGVFSALAIIIHNLPEGIITYLSSTQNLQLGIALTIAIALHNIPEGISISVPIYSATKSKKTAILYTLISAMAEPVGAILAFTFLQNIINDLIMGLILATTAGIMLYIGIFELLPTSFKYKEKYKTIVFFIIGFIFMIISHILMNKF